MNIGPRIVLANVIGLALVGSVLYVKFALPAVTGERPVQAITNPESVVREFIPVTDTNNNQTPDWLETFDIQEIDLTDVSSTTPYEPETVTGKMTESLLSAMAEAELYNKDAAAVEIPRRITDSFKKTYFIDEQYGRDDITVSTDLSVSTLRRYSNQVTQVSFDNSEGAGSEDEMTIFEDALDRNDADRLAELDLIARGYQGMADDMLTISVPSTMVREHLALTNVYQALANDISAFANAFDDPNLSLMRYERYPADADALKIAVEAFYGKLYEAGVRWNSSDITSRIIEVGE